MWVESGTVGLFPKDKKGINFINEQFWGRAARASSDSKESGRLFTFYALRTVPAIRFLPLILAHQFSLTQNVVLHRLLNFLFV